MAIMCVPKRSPERPNSPQRLLHLTDLSAEPTHSVRCEELAELQWHAVREFQISLFVRAPIQKKQKGVYEIKRTRAVGHDEIPGYLSDSGSFIEDRSKTFVVPSARTESADGASEEDMSGRHDMETLMSLVNTKFEKRERQIKSDMRVEIERRLERDKRHQEEIIAALRRDLSQLTKVSQECDGLKEQHRLMQQELNSQQEKNMSLREENTHLKMEAAKLQELTAAIESLKIENDTLRREKVTLEMRSVKLKSTIAERDQEILSLKTLIDTQYKRIKLDLTNTRDKFHNDQETIHTGMKQQNLMLAEISAAVQTISSGMGRSTGSKKDLKTAGEKTSSKSKVFVASGKTSSETSFNKLTGYTPKKRR